MRGGLEAGEPVPFATTTGSRQAWSRSASQVANTLLERPSTLSSSFAMPVPVRGPVNFDDHGHEPVEATSVPPHVFVDPDCGHLVELGRIVDQDQVPQARTASLAVFQATPSLSATHATHQARRGPADG